VSDIIRGTVLGLFGPLWTGHGPKLLDGSILLYSFYWKLG